VKIEGKIIDSSGEPLALANITIQDGSRAKKLGVSSDLDGNFKLENDVIEPNSTFMISYIGFKPKFLKASELNGKTIKMLESIEELPEITITGRPKPIVKITEKLNFKENLAKHKYVYAGVGALAGILLIMKSIKK
jgi:hypothetical protein